jgi:hypothetical protein
MSTLQATIVAGKIVAGAGSAALNRDGINERVNHPIENNTCNPESNSVKLRREIDESIRNLTREIIRLRRLKEAV